MRFENNLLILNIYKCLFYLQSNMVNVILNPFGKWWKAMEHSIAWRLLGRAQKGDRYDRMKAIHQLALIDHLKGNIFIIKHFNYCFKFMLEMYLFHAYKGTYFKGLVLHRIFLNYTYFIVYCMQKFNICTLACIAVI